MLFFEIRPDLRNSSGRIYVHHNVFYCRREFALDPVVDLLGDIVGSSQAQILVYSDLHLHVYLIGELPCVQQIQSFYAVDGKYRLLHF